MWSLATFIRKVALTAIVLFCTFAAAHASDLSVKLGGTEVEIGDRLRICSKIMGVDHIKQTLKIAEKEVRLLDTSIAGRPLKTRLLNEKGKPVELVSFKEGEMVLVLGYSDQEGQVYAIKIQRVDPASLACEPKSNHKSQFNRPKLKK